ncbi:hypothetical protein FBEOM_14384 [Fusarium beomiforme]|uniref:Uncharacterized protein n=1 Tax=Fusarium beomiforme TaxID=44412 RepID=A0A9P5A4N3_9HYPO|nr:hypothetical protein FBEOM_14384 [Fusarium beomiforme]
MRYTNLWKSLELIAVIINNVNAMGPGYLSKRKDVQAFPAMTSGPLDLFEKARLLQGHRLRERQASVSSGPGLTLTIAPDETCGYLSGSVGVPITCQNGAACSWELDVLGVIACSTDVFETCLESSIAVDQKVCDDVCQSDTWTLLCTDSDAPFCRTYAYPDGASDYRCASTPVTAIQKVEHTFKGDDSPGFITTTIYDNAETTAQVSTAVTSNTPTVPTTTTSTGTESSTATHHPKPTPVGAIVGGVIGGVAVLGLIGLGIVFMLRRRKPKHEITAPVIDPAMSQNPPPISQNLRSVQPHQLVAVSPHPDPGMASSPVLSDTRESILSGSVSVEPASPLAWNQQPSPVPYSSAAPAYQVTGPEAREPKPVFEMGSDSSTRK